MIRYLLNEIWFLAGINYPYTCTQKANTVIHISTNNTGHRAQKNRKQNI